VAEAATWQIDQIRVGSPATPEGVTELFLNDYIDQTRAAMAGGPVDMLQSGAYKEHALLSPEFVAQVAETIAGFEQGGYDPFLLAQDVPHAIFVDEAVIAGNVATVGVRRFFAGNQQPSPMTVHLERRDGRWLITAILPADEEIALLPAPGMSPEEVVEAFYAEWRESVTAAMRSSGDSPLASGAYHDSPYLTPAFARQVDRTIAGFDRGGYDPFLCAQDVPGELAVDGTIFTESGAQVALHSDFPDHALVVALEEVSEGEWRINSVICPGTPETNTLIFYTWYLAYTRNCCVLGMTDPFAQRSPLVDGAYHQAPYINPAFAVEVEAELARMHAGGASGYDPILQAQAFPPDFRVEAGEGEGMVIVEMAFANPHRLTVQMVLVDGQWLVSGVTRMAEAETAPPAAAGPDTSGWSLVQDSEHGFSFRIPADWVAEEQRLQGPGMPDDWPVQRMYLVMPAALAEELAGRSGPPSGDEIVSVPPFSVSFLYGDRLAFDRAFAPAAYEDKLHLNGQEILVQQQEGDYALPRYVFQDQRDPQRWVIVEDLVNAFPGREVQAAQVVAVLDGILLTMSLES
jgi:hypothetical protein